MRASSIRVAGFRRLLRFGVTILGTVLLGLVLLYRDVRAEHRRELAGLAANELPLPDVERSDTVADRSERGDVLAPDRVLRQHHRDRAGLARHAALDHAVEQTVFLLAMVAPVGEAAEDPDEASDRPALVLARARRLSREALERVEDTL